MLGGGGHPYMTLRWSLGNLLSVLTVYPNLYMYIIMVFIGYDMGQGFQINVYVLVHVTYLFGSLRDNEYYVPKPLHESFHRKYEISPSPLKNKRHMENIKF